jgi:CBS domain-containing protein
MKAADVMTRQVVTIEASAPITKAVRLMLQNRISGLPVVNAAGQLVGIVTEGDFLRRAETGTEVHRPHWLELLVGPGRLAGEYVRTHARKVEEVMTPDVVSVSEDMWLDGIVRLMEQRHIKRVPVLKDGKVAGIISRANLLRALAGHLVEMPPASADDRALRESILAEIQKQSWAPHAGVDVTVHGGVVDLWGAIMDERERQAFRVAAENIPGVKTVKDHLCFVEPMSGWVMEAPESDAEPMAQGSR